MRWAIGLAAASAATCVIIGAVSAHISAELGNPEKEWIETALHYQIWNSLGLLAAGILGHIWQTSRLLFLSSLSLAAGVFLFSGSLYIMAFTRITSLGILTPAGGICLITGWLLLAVAALRRPPAENSP